MLRLALVELAVQGDDVAVFIDVVSEEAATGPAAAYYADAREDWGFLPDYVFAFGARPEVAAAWGTLSTAIRAGMDRRLYELVTVAAARASASTACTVAHSKFLRDECAEEATVRLIALDPEGNSLAPVDRAVFQFAGKVARDAASVEQVDIDRLRALGLSDADITSVVYAAAARCFFTRVLDGLGVQLDPQTAQAFSPDLLASMVVGRPVPES